jgi:hypothetical protein
MQLDHFDLDKFLKPKIHIVKSSDPFDIQFE